MNFATLNKKWFHEVNILVTIPSPIASAQLIAHAFTSRPFRVLALIQHIYIFWCIYLLYLYKDTCIYTYILLNICMYTTTRARIHRGRKKCMGEEAQQTEPRANQVLWPVAFPITLRLGSPGVQNAAGCNFSYYSIIFHPIGCSISHHVYLTPGSKYKFILN